jgi:hypothetical protein
MEKDAFAEKCFAVLGTVFPAGADIKIMPGDDLTFSIDWLLDTDPNRPNKTSSLINLKISREAMEDCDDFSRAERKLRKLIQEKLSHFNPEHENPRHVQILICEGKRTE